MTEPIDIIYIIYKLQPNYIASSIIYTHIFIKESSAPVAIEPLDS